jgi:L-alanine-DL-glutamate epimerase-like enolase superfamily enzyme
MKITKIASLSLGEFPNVLWVTVHTDAGPVGLGETYFGSGAVAAYLHETLAPQVLGQDPLTIEKHARALLQNYVGFKSSSAEIRGASAFDVALWDILGQVSNLPLYTLLDGKVRDGIRTYNTCAGYRYVRSRPTWSTGNWGLDSPEPESPYEDLEGFLHRADDLAESLLAEGYRGMKIWPFDFAAEASSGTDITVEQLRQGLEPFEKIRKAVGDRIEIHVELHGLWQLPAAMKVAREIEPFRPYWFEDPVKSSNIDALRQFRRGTRYWTAASETLATRWSFRELFESQATDVVIADIGWCGGLSEAKKIVTMAESYDLPFAPHDCTGPVLLAACVHLCTASPNALVQEVVRAFYHGWYRELVTDLPPLRDGFIAPLESPGLGLRLKPELWERRDAVVRVSEWNP